MSCRAHVCGPRGACVAQVLVFYTTAEPHIHASFLCDSMLSYMPEVFFRCASFSVLCARLSLFLGRRIGAHTIPDLLVVVVAFENGRCGVGRVSTHVLLVRAGCFYRQGKGSLLGRRWARQCPGNGTSISMCSSRAQQEDLSQY